MDIILNPHDSQPIYKQLENQLRKAMLENAFPHGKCPRVRDIAATYHLGHRTVERAYAALIDEGLCISRPRIGLYVNPIYQEGYRRRIVYLGSSFYRQAAAEYGSRLIGLTNAELYPQCKIDMRYDDYAQNDLQLFLSEVKNIATQQVDCLILNLDLRVPREAISELLNMPLLMFVIGDFSFGEIHESGLNQIREDTSERGATFVRLAASAGKRDLVLVTHAESDNYYVSLLMRGARQQAQELGIAIRFLPYTAITDPLYENCMQTSALRQDVPPASTPDAVIFDGYYSMADQLVTKFRQLWGDQLLFISNGNVIDGGVFLHADYTRFAKAAADIILDAMENHKHFLGQKTLSNLITYRALTGFLPGSHPPSYTGGFDG